ncbi:DUF1353 domain-containing protein [Aureimonas sp. AU22]|uniref:DUF1353 domain-containing protein n=1 Tax=Aureimonas sp. AU22 TaxID=1638162 RepID=UPI0007849079|nr:DUF1353 domain-containing protein [Aureimonas sp. AU22]
MGAYTDAPVIFERLGGIQYRQHGATHWEIGRKGSNYWFEVDDGTLFDVSIPAGPLRLIFDPHDPRYLKAAALHDELLRQGFDRVTAAGAFNQALNADGVSAARRFVMTAAVAFFRWS